MASAVTGRAIATLAGAAPTAACQSDAAAVGKGPSIATAGMVLARANSIGREGSARDVHRTILDRERATSFAKRTPRAAVTALAIRLVVFAIVPRVGRVTIVMSVQRIISQKVLAIRAAPQQTAATTASVRWMGWVANVLLAGKGPRAARRTSWCSAFRSVSFLLASSTST